jgi:hypothetical protein
VKQSRCTDLWPDAVTAPTMVPMSYRTGETSRRVIDLATGILVGLRSCSEREAFAELVAVVHRTGIGLGGIARALVAIAGPPDDAVPHQAEAFDAWADLLAARANLYEPNTGAMHRF